MASSARHAWRAIAAVAISLVVHAVLVWRLQSTRAPPLRTRPLQLTELVWLEPSPPPLPPAPSVNAARVPLPKAKTPAPPPVTKRTELAPQLPSVLPTKFVLPSSPGEPSIIARPGGVTLRPGDLPTPEALRAATEARVQARVDGWLKGAIGQARAAKGLPDPAYGALGEALREATDDVPKLIDTDSPEAVSKAFAGAWLSGAERYGKTGAPYDEPEGRQEFIEHPSALEAAVQNGSPQARQLQQFISAGARLQEFADGRTGVEVYALLEVHQRDSGEVASVRLVKPSGLQGFDAWVLERSNGVQLALTWDAGARRKPLRSVWRFDAIMKFRRKLKLKELDGRAVVGMLALSVLSGLSAMGDGAPRLPTAAGRFDETTGEIDVVDLTNPTWDCAVKLEEAD